MTWTWNRSTAFSERVDRLNLHGLHFQHVSLCERRVWLYMHKVNFAQWYERVATGTARHRESHVRDKSVAGLFGLSPDRIDWENRIVYEDKGSAGAKEASDNQTAFYAVMLSIASGKTWRAVTHVLSTRKHREVVIDETRLEKLWIVSERLEILAAMQTVPEARRIPLCEMCSPAVFCGFA